MKTTDIVYISVSDLNYEGVTKAAQINRAEWFRRVKWDGRYLVERVSPGKYAKILLDMSAREYDKAIQNKYNVGPNWRQNRWFVEQIRPTA